MPHLFTRVTRFVLSLLLVAGLSQATAQAQAPAVSSLLPARNAVAAPRTGPVSLTFTQAITAASAPALRVYGSQLRGKRPGTLSGGGTTTLSLAPTQSFAAGERVSVTVPNTLVNGAGTAVARQVYQFTAGTGGGGRGFFLDTTEVAYTTTRDQLLGDIDNDGDLDLLTSNGLFGMFSYLNNGTGVFTPNRNTVIGNTPSCATLADVDGDGDLDLLGGDADNPTIAIALNDGTGIFGFMGLPAQNLIVGNQPMSVTTGDIDADGDLDMVCANYGSNSVSIGFNNGNGLFGGTVNLGVGTQPTTVQLADIDSDGDLDILTTSRNTNAVVVRLNNGAGSFSTGPTIGVGAAPSDLALADIDRDGDLDLLVTNASGASVSVRLNNGFGAFAGTTTLALPAGSTPTGLGAGDVDADGDLDLVVAQGTGGQVITYLNNGFGTFTRQYAALELASTSFGPAVTLGVTLGDVDGDGDLDVVTAEDRTKRVVMGRDGIAPPPVVPTVTGFTPGAGPVGTTGIRIAGTALASASAVAFNGVAAAFVATANTEVTATVPAGATTGPISVTTVGGTATTTQSFVITSGAVPRVNVLSTVPGANAVAGSRTTSVSVTFDAPISSSSVSALVVTGMQRRGRQQASVSGGGTATLVLAPNPAFAPGERVSVSIPAVLTGTSGGSVRPKVVEFLAATGGLGEGLFNTSSVVSSALGAQTPALQAADIDNDGDADLVGLSAVSGSTNAVLLLLNNGSGTFAASPAAIALNANPIGVLPADVDGDGDLDLVLTVYSTAQSQWRLDIWLNNGQGQFAATAQVTGINSADRLQTGDMDADGDLDLVFFETASSGAYRLRVALNNGGGTFALSSTAVVPSYINRLQLADLDNDGDLDVVMAYNAQLGSALNDGQGALTVPPALNAALGYTLNDLKVGDLTGDGVPDLVALAFDYNGSGVQPSPFSIYPGLGNGQFGPHGPVYLAERGPVSLHVADFNADGKLDVLTLTGGGSGTPAARMDVLLGNGRGGLQFPATYAVAPVGQTVVAAEVADFDGDGSLDVVVVNGTLPALVLQRNLGRPAPTITGLAPTAGAVGARVVINGTNLTSVRQVTFGGVAAATYSALSNTQCTALVPAGALSGPVTVSTPAGTATSAGAFTVLVPTPASSFAPGRNAVSAPRNGSVSVSFAQALPASTAGDLLVRGEQRQGRRSGTASGAGTATRSFAPALGFVPGERVQATVPRGAAAGGFPGLVYDFTAATGGIGVGNMRRNSYLALESSPFHNVAGDFDEDGAPDLVSRELFAQQLRVQFNDGQGRFAARSQVLPSSMVRAVRVADLNNDSHLDLVISEFYNYRGSRELNRLLWRAGAGNGTFGPAQFLHILTGAPADIVVGDLNGDGLTDLAVPITGADSVLVSLNMGNGTFQRQPDVAGVVNIKQARLADLDNDGILDLVTVGRSTEVSLGFGTGAGGFVPAPSITLPQSAGAVEVADVNGDGNVDLVISTAISTFQGSLLVRPGTGTGSFGPAQTSAITVAADYLRLGDFDADGDLDVAFCNLSTYSGGQIAFNDGSGVFAQPMSFAPNTVVRSLAVADFNLDGSLDLALMGDSVSTGRSGLFMYLNRPAAPFITSFAPASGPVGTVITLTGTGFTPITRVTIGGVAVAFTVVSNTQITITTTAAVATGTITVSGPAGAHTSSGVFTVPVPSIAGFTPGSGAVQRVVTLTGLYFGGTTAVRFNGTPAPGFVLASGTQLSVAVPAGATTGPITVTTPSGTGTSATAFVVVPNPRLLSVAPARHGSSAPLAGPIALTYSQPMDAAGAATGMRLHSALRGRRGGAVSGGGALAFAPAAPLLPGEEVALTVPAGLLDQNGNLVLGPGHVLTFRGATGGTGRGALVAETPLTLPVQTRRFIAADFTGDNAVDFLTFASPFSAVTIGTLYRNTGTGTFTVDPSFNLPQGDYSYLGQADLDEDGDLDLVGTNPNATSPGWVQPLLNDGQGHFAAAPNSGRSTSYGLLGQALGDVTGDGHIDLVLRDQTGLRVYPGNGLGDFLPPLPGAIISTLPMDEVRLADLDNDGDLDLLTSGYVQANYYTGVVSVLFNNGQGQFAVPATPPRYEYGYLNINLNDFDGDGDLDLMLRDNYRPGVTFYANDGAGGFARRVRYLGFPGPTPNPDGLVVGDLDADGDLDLLVGTYGNSLNLLRNTGNVTFAQPMTVATTQSGPVGLADFDGDGDLDVLTVSGFPASTNFRLLRNHPVPPPLQLLSHTPASNALNVPNNATVRLTFNQALTVANYDAWRAFASQRQGRRRASYALAGTPTPELTPQDALLPGEQVSVSVPPLLQAAPAAAGVPGARVKPEVFQYTAAVGGVGIGNFGVAPQAPNTFGLNIGPPTDVITADFNDDGVPDILTAGIGPFSNPITQMFLRLGDPNRSGAFAFSSTLLPFANNARGHIAAVDFDNDGDLDAAIVDDYGSTPGPSLRVAINNGNAFVSNMYFQFYLVTGAYAIAFADFDGDGDQDLALTRPQAVDIYLNTRGAFVDPPYVFAHGFAQPVGLAVGDLDNNGGLDLAFTDAATGAVSVWYNANIDEASVSGQVVALSLGSGAGFTAKDVKLGDLDGDGDLDLAVLGATGAATGEARLYRSAGPANSFALARTLPLSDAPNALALADLDHDGDLDLTITAGTAQLRFNGGNFGFAGPATGVTVGGVPGPLVLADFDTDGDLDLITLSTSSAAGGLTLRLNGGTVLAARAGAESLAAALRLYPNPVSGASQRVQLQVPGLGAQAATVLVYNSVGQVVHRQHVSAISAGTATLALPSLAAGAYLVRVAAPDRQLSRVLLVE